MAAAIIVPVPRKELLRDSPCRSADPLDVARLPFTGDCTFVLVTPKFEAPTREMRAALPANVPFKSMIANSVAGGSLVRSLALLSCSCHVLLACMHSWLQSVTRAELSWRHL
jgi:homoserine kinase